MVETQISFPENKLKYHGSFSLLFTLHFTAKTLSATLILQVKIDYDS